MQVACSCCRDGERAQVFFFILLFICLLVEEDEAVLMQNGEIGVLGMGCTDHPPTTTR